MLQFHCVLMNLYYFVSPSMSDRVRNNGYYPCLSFSSFLLLNNWIRSLTLTSYQTIQIISYTIFVCLYLCMIPFILPREHFTQLSINPLFRTVHFIVLFMVTLYIKHYYPLFLYLYSSLDCYGFQSFVYFINITTYIKHIVNGFFL